MERPSHFVDVVNPFCSDCQLESCPEAGRGCPKYRRRFVKNWNENISAAPKVTKEYFRYERPDLVREGIAHEHVT